MKYYSELLALGCFKREALTALTGNYATAGTLLQRYMQKGYVRRVKKNLFVAINLADNEPVASKYRVAGKITQTAYVSHHAAFEYYGCANQVSYQVEVSSETPFASFGFNGSTYTCFASRIADGVATRPDGVRISDMERTVLDSIHDFKKVMGLEELLRCMALVPALDENRLLRYLSSYDKQVLYQKTGYILQHFQDEFRLSNSFFTECAAHIGKSSRYLTADKHGEFDKRWRLVVPHDFMTITTKGAGEYADV